MERAARESTIGAKNHFDDRPWQHGVQNASVEEKSGTWKVRCEAEVNHQKNLPGDAGELRQNVLFFAADHDRCFQQHMQLFLACALSHFHEAALRTKLSKNRK